MSNTKDIKDYLHLYLGCEVLGEYADDEARKGYLTGVTNGAAECEIQFFLEDGFNVSEYPEWNDSAKVKILLTPLSEMTKEDFRATFFDKELAAIDDAYSFEKQFLNCPKSGDVAMYARDFLYLLLKGFDLFNLIPEGLAIDKTNVTNI